MTRVILALPLAVLLALSARAQTGTWQTHTDMQHVRAVVTTGGGLWAATGGGVFHRDAGGSFTRYTNIDGLGATDFTAIASDAAGRVVAGASNGILNVRATDGSWTTVRDIARASFPQRAIRVITGTGGLAYIGTDFGMVAFDAARMEFGDTYQKFGSLPTPAAVNDVFLAGGFIWVASDRGVARADASSPNLQDPANWTSWTTAQGRSLGAVRAVNAYQGTVLIATGERCYQFDGADWQPALAGLDGTDVRRLRGDGSSLYAVSARAVYRVLSLDDVEQLGDKTDQSGYPRNTTFSDVAFAGIEMFAAGSKGVSAWSTPWRFAHPDGPNANLCVAFAVDPSGGLWACSGISAGGSGVYRFDGGRWTNYTVESHPGLTSDAIVTAAAGPGAAMYFGTWGSGVVRLGSDSSFRVYNRGTVPAFPGITTDPAFCVVQRLRTDESGRLWSLHYQTNAELVGVFDTDERWHFYRSVTASGAQQTADLTIDPYGTKWCVTQGPFYGVVLFNDQGTLIQTGDDRWQNLPAANPAPAGIDANMAVTAVATDRIGDVWIGTDRGLRAQYNPQSNTRFDKPCYTQICNIEGLYITCLAIDAVNNKWIGTKEGVFVLTPDGTEILAQYTTENSPLLDNDISALLVHPQTGTAWIATAKGISALQTPYVEAVVEAGTLVVSPNPFRPGIDDRVTIDGLSEGSSLKVLSVSGTLVASLTTPGGRIGYWDGRTRDGSLAPSGMYFIVATSADGTQTTVAKVALVRP